VKKRLVRDLLPADPTSAEAKRLVARGRRWAAVLRRDGSWKDIDYRDQTYSSWEPAQHVRRIQDIAIAWRLGGCDPKLKAAVLRAFDGWRLRDPRCPNYWWNAIGVPRGLYPTLFLMEKELTDAQMKTGLRILARGYTDGKWDYHGDATGQNLVWIASLQVYRAVLLGDERAAAHHLKRIGREIVIARGEKEGVKSDNSFWQHGAILYAGGYGRAFSVDSARLAWLTGGTKLAFPRAKLDLLSSYILDGQLWMCRGGAFDYSAVGREIARPGAASSRSIGKACVYMAEVAGPRRQEFARAAAALERGAIGWDGEPSGNRHFWRSDFMVHRRPAFYVSVKMVSTRTVGTESGNGENLLGYHLPDGCAYVMRHGNEYAGTFPFWEWRRVPGVTCEQTPGALPQMKWGRGARGTKTFVGGVSDGTDGVAAFDYARRDVRARKAWFCFGDAVVCLGTGIACTGDAPVATSVNQCRMEGSVATSEDGGRGTNGSFTGPGWVHHDGVGYVFPRQARVRVEAGPKQGNWHWINSRCPDKVETANLFSLWIEHGKQPDGGEYAYVLLPGADAKATARFARGTAVIILENTPSMQAVHDRKLGLTGAVFYRRGTLVIERGPKIAVDRPCILLVRTDGEGGLRLAAAKPDSAAKPIRVAVDGKSFTIDLPKGEFVGRSVLKDLRR
jgi:chondroitin AC lyase